MKDIKKPFFDSFAKNYRDIHDENIRFSGVDSNYFSEYKILKIKQENKGENLKYIKVILDLGCGDGNCTKFFFEHFPEAQIWGLDVSESSIIEAKNKHLANSTFLVYDGKSLPFKSNTIDLVFLACVLHHVDSKNHQKLIAECCRVLNSSGQIYIFEHNPYNPITRKIVKDCIFDRDAVMVKANYLTNVLKEGFKHIRTKYIVFFPRKGIFNKILFLENYLFWLPLGGQYYIRAFKI